MKIKDAKQGEKMLLSEILNLKSDVKFTDAVEAFVNKHGIKAFKGSNATVIDRDGYVWRTWFNDPGFERFLKYIESNKSNPHLPKILSRVREEPVQFKGMPKGMKIKYVKVEKLSDLEPGDLSDAIGAALILANRNIKSTSVDELADLIAKKNIVPSDSDATSFEIAGTVRKYKKFFEVINDLHNDHRANDIISSNVMMRGDVPVITDPFSDVPVITDAP